MRKFYKYNQLYIGLILMLAITSIAGLVSNITALQGGREIGEELTPLVDACMEIKLTVTEAHLWFEESVTGYETEGAYDVTMKALDESVFYANAILEGGINDEGDFRPLKNEEGRQEMELVIDLITDFRELAVIRHDNIKFGDKDDTVLDTYFDEIYEALIGRTDTVETIVQEAIKTELASNEIRIMISMVFMVAMAVSSIIFMVITIHSVNVAKDSNPLSGLPGNTSIVKEISHHIKLKDGYSVIYGDLDNFKAYNDKYGFGRGDEVLKFTSELLTDISKRTGNESFVGHIGGDDFVLVVHSMSIPKILDEIIRAFDEGIVHYYRKADLENGTFISVDRNGRETEFSIVSISLAVAHIADFYDKSYLDVVDACTEMKKIAKLTDNSNYEIYN